MRVTDLETFAFEQVMRPFWPTLQEQLGPEDWRRESYHLPYRTSANHVGGYRRLEHTLADVAGLLDVGPIDWRMDVFTRLYRMGVTFAPYVEHKLVVVCTIGMGMAHANRTVDQ